MLKITGQRNTESAFLTLILEGRLAGPWVEALDAYRREMSENQQRCAMIDLTAVTFIDAKGKALLTQLWQQGVELRASGCLTRCLVDEITGATRQDAKKKTP
jgi:anti-anti-sigma regulatory factor